MTERPEHDELHEDPHDDLLLRLQGADPAADLPPADAATVARLLEDPMRSPTRRRTPLTWLVAAAAVTLIAVASLTALLGRGDDAPTAAGSGESAGQDASGAAPTVTELTAAPPADARCRMPTAELVAAQEMAFVGTVESVEEGSVTLVPSRFYRGAETDKVEVSAPPAALNALIGAVRFTEGETYLVSATDGRVSVCGLSGPLTAEREQLYDAAFGG